VNAAPPVDPVAGDVARDVGDDATARPMLRVVRGAPDDVELAALVAVVAAASAAAVVAPRPVRSQWADPARSVRGPLPTGGWRASSAPR
jgi:hypothetical protein